jgi:hypothetical protein
MHTPSGPKRERSVSIAMLQRQWSLRQQEGKCDLVVSLKTSGEKYSRSGPIKLGTGKVRADSLDDKVFCSV